MALFTFDGVHPTVDRTAFVAPTASVIGDVTIEAGASVWFGAVLRGDVAPIRICRGANVQDGSILHAAPGGEVHVGPDATVAHLCVVHGVRIEDRGLIANGATVLDGVTVGSGSLVAAHSMVPAGLDIPAGMLAAGSPAVVKREIAGTPSEELVLLNGPAYAELAQRYLQSFTQDEG